MQDQRTFSAHHAGGGGSGPRQRPGHYRRGHEHGEHGGYVGNAHRAGRRQQHDARVILKNTGVVTTTTPNGGGPALRLTPSAEIVPSSTTGGDLTTTTGGLLWFTHNLGGTPPAIIAAPVLTEATGNVYAGLPAPRRILDTRSASGRTNIVNPSGNLDSSHRLLAGKTIFINLDSLVFFADAVFANITVTGMARSGWLLVWSGAGTRPTASTINFGTATLSNFLASSIAEFSTTILNVIAIITTTTTHVILDVAGFSTPGFEFANSRRRPPPPGMPGCSGHSGHAQRQPGLSGVLA